MLKTHIKRQFRDSGQLEDSNSVAVTPNSIYVFNLDKRFILYDSILITNASGNDCLITINNSHTSFSPKGNSIEISNLNVRDVRFKNIGSTNISIDEMRLFYRHTGNEGKIKLKTASEILSSVVSISLLKRFI